MASRVHPLHPIILSVLNSYFSYQKTGLKNLSQDNPLNWNSVYIVLEFPLYLKRSYMLTHPLDDGAGDEEYDSWPFDG